MTKLSGQGDIVWSMPALRAPRLPYVLGYFLQISLRMPSILHQSRSALMQTS